MTMDHAQEIRSARAILKDDHQEGLAALNAIFRAGSPPDPPPDGRYAGEFVALNLAPGLTPLVQGITQAWMPWKGKTFEAARARGDNVFTRDSLALRAFAFRTTLGPGRTDPDRQVLKIDYDLPVNPQASVRRLLDELVQIGDSLYLGKAHLKWWWGRWQLVAYFSKTPGGRLKPSPRRSCSERHKVARSAKAN